MARQKGIIKLKGTIGAITFVDSAAYGPHPRAARGTFKEAKINDVLQGNANNSSKVGALGSPILQQLKAIDKGFAPGNLWSRMTGRMFKAESMKAPDLLQSLKGLELNERYAYSKLFSAPPKLSFSVKKNRLMVEVEILSHAGFSKVVKASHYLCELFVLFFAGKGGCVVDRMETEWISFDEDLGVYEMEFMVPKGAKYFLMVEGIKGGRDGSEVESFTAKGLRIGEWGKC